MMCEALIGLVGALIGAVAAIFASWVAVKAQYRAERRRFYTEKQYEIFSLVLEFMYGFLDLMGERVYFVEDITVTFEEQCAYLSKLERMFRPQLSMIFEENDISFVDQLSEDISDGVSAKKKDGDAKFTTTPEQLNALIKTVKKKYLGVEVKK